MQNFICFLIGIISGGAICLVVLSCFQINKINEYEREIERLKNSNNNKSL